MNGKSSYNVFSEIRGDLTGNKTHFQSQLFELRPENEILRLFFVLRDN